jgi:AraC family transcriptional regulator
MLQSTKTAYRKEYISRINKAIDFIEQNLENELNLDTISEAACFSKYHFHRIFSAFTQETLHSFVQRKRLERAASYIITQPVLTVSEIAYKCGFSSLSAFSRAFQQRFGMSASELSNDGYDKFSKNRKLHGKYGKINLNTSLYLRMEEIVKPKINVKMEVQIKDLPDMHVAYVRHTGAFNQVYKAYEKLMAWAGPRGLIRFPETKLLTVFHDDPKVTEESKLLQSACLTVEKGTKTEGEIGTMIVQGGKYALAHFEISQDEFQAAWDAVMANWLPDSGWQCDDKYPFELYHNNHEEHPEKKFILDICVPVKPL